jgi:hypothetical protein
MSAWPEAMMAFGLLRIGDEADGDGRQAGLALDALGQMHLVARPQRDLLQGRNAAAGHVDEAKPALAQGGGKHHALVDVPAAFDPVGGRDANAQFTAPRHRRAHGIDHFQRIAHALVERSAVGIVAPVGQRRKELVQQVAVRRMQFDGIEPEAQGPLR